MRRTAETTRCATCGSLAHLVLLHWNVPGTSDRLLAKLREPENEWLSDRVWDKHLPRGLVPLLEALAREMPERYRERVAELTHRGR